MTYHLRSEGQVSAKIVIGLLTALCASQAGADNRDSPLIANNSTAPAGQGDQLQEIIVTAQRREENLQRVPVSVSAVTATQMLNQQVVDVITLANVVSNMQVKPTLGPTEDTLAIRGVTQLIPSVNVDPSIGMYIDGVYNVINAGSNNAMIDMERAEVLKGPQGTLFGRNTIGGALNITTAKPTNEFGGYVDTSYGNYNTSITTAVLNLPIVPGVVDTRWVYQHSQHDGYGNDYTTGNPTATLRQDYARGTIDIKPSDSLDVMLTGSYVHSDGLGFPSNLAYMSPTASIAPGLPPTNVLIPALSGHPGDLLSNYILPPGDWNTYSGVDNRFSFQQAGFTGTVVAALSDSTSFKSITAFTNTTNTYGADLGGTPYIMVDVVAYPLEANQFSQELQLYGKAFSNRLQWIAGLYYFGVTGSQVSYVEALPALSPPGQATLNPTGPSVNNRSYSGYGQLTYEVVPDVRITGGARFVEDTRDATYRDAFTTLSGTYIACDLANAPGDPNAADCRFAADVKYHYVPWTAGIDWTPAPDALLYTKVSQGYRSGAFGLTGPPAVLPSAQTGITPEQAAAANAFNISAFGPVAPEKLISPEIGGKFEFLDHRLRINAAAFYSSYSNIQLSINLPASCPTCTPDSQLQNSGKARIYGGELEVSALLGKLQLDGNVGYADPKYTSGPFVGTPVVNVSKTTAALTGTYPLQMSFGTLNVSSTYSYRSSADFYALAPGLPPEAAAATRQSGFGQLEARLALNLSSIPLTISVYGQNLTNKQYIVSGETFAPPLGFGANSPGTPRTYAVGVRYTF